MVARCACIPVVSLPAENTAVFRSLLSTITVDFCKVWVPECVIELFVITFNDVQKSHGCKVESFMWKNSRHVEHLRLHPQEYKEAIATFLKDL
jgi:hypothetical protein